MAYTEKFLIYIVDDEPTFTKVFKKHLETKFRSAIDVRVFRSGETVLKSLDSHPDLIFLDYHLDAGKGKKMNGYEVLDKIKADKPYIPVAMISQESNFSMASEAINRGAANYIHKDPDSFKRAAKLISDLIKGATDQ
jgi:two-component system response regulator FlrC